MRLRCARASLRSSEEDSVRGRLRDPEVEEPASDSGAGEGEEWEREEGSMKVCCSYDMVGKLVV
jgi:hypothetical protein